MQRGVYFFALGDQTSCYNIIMSPRNFAKAQMGPYFLSSKHYDRNDKPHIHLTKKEKVLKYSGITYIVSLFKSRRVNKK